MMTEDKDAIIRQQWAIIRDQHQELVQLRYHIDQHDLLYEHPWSYFFWRIFVWPFKTPSLR